MEVGEGVFWGGDAGAVGLLHEIGATLKEGGADGIPAALQVGRGLTAVGMGGVARQKGRKLVVDAGVGGIDAAKEG